MAKNNDYSVLGKLYGLNQDQIDRLQGTGAYAPVVYYGGDDGGSGGGGSSGGGGGVTFKDVDKNAYNLTQKGYDAGAYITKEHQAGNITTNQYKSLKIMYGY